MAIQSNIHLIKKLTECNLTIKMMNVKKTTVYTASLPTVI